ncbi:MAG: prepilin-type N-terminal cleavage/methylation domain-containing protein [Alphaproteobacteria bacterium]|nr:prepilin-type N-terminal cleavage/methylation domain-containing protein [Alphaproteobacteria bacterium]
MKKISTLGFTLVEMALVLMIIGLLVGAVLVGKDMITSAEVRSASRQLEEINAAATAFRARFNSLPGDTNKAMSLFDTATWTGLQNGNLDHILTDGDKSSAYATKADADEFSGELAQFWYHLTASELIKGHYDTTAKMGEGFPLSKLGVCGVAVANLNGVNADGLFGTPLKGNYFQIGVVDSPNPGTDDSFVTENCLTAYEARSLDQKLDDGHPLTGRIRAVGNYDDGGGSGTVPGLGRLPRVFEYDNSAPYGSPTQLTWLGSVAYTTTSLPSIDDACLEYSTNGNLEDYRYITQSNARQCQIIYKAAF